MSKYGRLPEAGYIRLSEILMIIPVSKSTWWAGVKSGRFPKSVKLGPRITAWRVEDIRNLMNEMGLNQNFPVCVIGAKSKQDTQHQMVKVRHDEMWVQFQNSPPELFLIREEWRRKTLETSN